MPVIPGFEPDIAAEAQRPVVANPAAMARTGEALAAGGRELSDQMAAFTDKYVQARMASEASDQVVKNGAALDQLRHKWSLVPDRQQALAGFNADVAQLKASNVDKISNPFIQAHVSEQFGAQALTAADDVGRQSFGLESSARRGQLDQNLLDLSTQYAQAPNDHARAIISDNAHAAIAGAAKGGWIAPEEATQHEIKWRSTSQEQVARADMNNAIDAQNPDAMYRLAQRLTDPANYPGMQQETREQLRTHVETLAYRLDMRAAQRQAHDDMVAERNMVHAQAHNEAVMLAGVNAGTPLSDAQIQTLADHGQISAGGVEALHTAKNRAEDGRDDPLTAAHLWDAIGNNRASTGDVYSLFGAGKISKPTMIDAVKAIDAKNAKGDSAVDKANYGTLKTALAGGAIESGNWGALGASKEDAKAEWTQAQREWNRRVVIGGEDSNAVINDMLPRYASYLNNPNVLPATKYGRPQSMKDVLAIAGRLGAALKAKQIAPSDFTAQGDLLNDWRRFYALKEQSDAAKGKRPGPVQQKTGAQVVGVTNE